MVNKRKSRSSNSSSERKSTLNVKSSTVVRVLKWIGAILTILTLAGSLIGYGIWIGSTNVTITSIKDDIKDLESKDTKASTNLTTLLEKVNERLQGFEIILTKQQSSIEALHSEIRLRHQDEAYFSKLLETSLDKNQKVNRWSTIKRQRVQESIHHAAEDRAAKASDSVIGESNRSLPEILQDNPMEGLEF